MRNLVILAALGALLVGVFATVSTLGPGPLGSDPARREIAAAAPVSAPAEAALRASTGALPATPAQGRDEVVAELPAAASAVLSAGGLGYLAVVLLRIANQLREGRMA